MWRDHLNKDLLEIVLRVLLPELIERAFSEELTGLDRKSTRLNSSHGYISYAVFCLKKKKIPISRTPTWPRRASATLQSSTLCGLSMAVCVPRFNLLSRSLQQQESYRRPAMPLAWV